MMVELPPEFVRTVENSFGGNGRYWLETFPALLDEAARRWNLTDIRPVPNLSYNFVAFAKKLPSPLGSPPGALSEGAGGEDEFILKLGVPQRELTSEIAALRFYNGSGICRLLDADAEKGMLLLERLEPGHMLATVMDDERATRIAAEVMKNLWKSRTEFNHAQATAPAHADGAGEVVTTDFIQLKAWFDGFQHLRQAFDGGTGPLPKQLVESAESLSSALLSENKDEVLLHGDFHHFNVLESTRGWLAIDPKGVIGPRGYEVGPFLFNPIDRFLNEGNPRTRTERRIFILSESLGMERERIRAWGMCHAVLSAWWCIEGNDPVGREYSLRCAEIFKQLGV
jgi:streptomycin 6-kinase